MISTIITHSVESGLDYKAYMYVWVVLTRQYQPCRWIFSVTQYT